MQTGGARDMSSGVMFSLKPFPLTAGLHDRRDRAS